MFGGGTSAHRNETDLIAWRLLNAPEFQRLRRIRQLGFSDLVFPGATHSRFAHSVGVYHTARRLADVIARRLGEEHDRGRDPDRERVALLAALLHDIGHGPFSHAFESAAVAVGLRRRHEEWSAEIVRGDTRVNGVLREADETLPDRIGALLTEEDRKDIYSAIVSSQFDADRLDYIQRDRLMAGVQFGNIDLDWLLDCLEVGTVTIGNDDPLEAPCLYLGPKGVQVAEEYLEARSRLYRMVYMHKTTRAAEKMLRALLSTVASSMRSEDAPHREPVLRYLTSEAPTLGSYLALDDSSIWAALSIYSELVDRRISELAQRLRDRVLYKCVDIGVRDKSDGNLFGRFRGRLQQAPEDWSEVLFDDATVEPYKWYSFDDASALNKVLVKTRDDMSEPIDIVGGLTEARAEGRIAIEEKPGRHGVPYAIFKSKVDPPRHLGDLSDCKVRDLLNKTNGSSDIVLELAATMTFLHDEWDYYGKGETDEVEETRARKPLKATDERIDKAIALLCDLGLRERASPITP